VTRALEALDAADWADMGETDMLLRRILEDVAREPGALATLVRRSLEDHDHVSASSRTADGFSLLLHRSPEAALELRLVGRPPCAGGPLRADGVHRTALNLAGEYRHIFYGDDGAEPEFIADEGPGVAYTLHAEGVHALLGRDATIFLEFSGSPDGDRRPAAPSGGLCCTDLAALQSELQQRGVL
jgi:hypothetical protein